MSKGMNVLALCLAGIWAAASVGCQPSPTSAPAANKAPDQKDKTENKDKPIKPPPPELGE
jgi:hypothetical protein